MKLMIDNLDGQGARDYTLAVDETRAPRVLRRHQQPSELRLSLIADDPGFVVPQDGARITMGRLNGFDVFTGYISAAPTFEYLGWNERGPVYRYNLVALSDESLLDRKVIPDRHSFVARGAGEALRQLTEDLLPGVMDTTAIASLDGISSYFCDQQKRWSEHAAEIATRARAAYRVMGNKVFFQALGTRTHILDESESSFSANTLKLRTRQVQGNDLIVTGYSEPQAHVKDYFVGDELTTRFYLSQSPFGSSGRTLLEEEYKGSTLTTTRWAVTDPAHVVRVNAGTLQLLGGTGVDARTLVSFVEKIELGGALVLQHGDVKFDAQSTGVLGGLYAGAISTAQCLAGFRVSPAGSNSNLQALINGTLSGPVLTTQGTHRYVLSTRLYASEVYRKRQMFHSSAHPAGAGRGGQDVPASVRVVLEVHDIDPANPGSMTRPSTVLYDGVLPNAPALCTYALVNAANLHCSIAFSRLLRLPNVQVRSARQAEGFRTRLVGARSEGAECRVSGDPAVQFFPQSIPAANEQIVVRYRGSGQSVARVKDGVSVAAESGGWDDGVRGAVLEAKSPPPYTSVDCENAALALLDDLTRSGCAGEYETWSDFLPDNAEDIFPGDAIQVNAPSRGASFRAYVREVDIEVCDLAGEHSRYTVRFADDAAEPWSFTLEKNGNAGNAGLAAVDKSQVGSTFLNDLSEAEVTTIGSTSVTVDAGTNLNPGWVIEVRTSDYGWGVENDRNLLGRFASRTFSLPRLGTAQTYFLRQHDGSSPAKYSRFSTALHIDYPL
jgi:hypothetical protein